MQPPICPLSLCEDPKVSESNDGAERHKASRYQPCAPKSRSRVAVLAQAVERYVPLRKRRPGGGNLATSRWGRDLRPPDETGKASAQPAGQLVRNSASQGCSEEECMMPILVFFLLKALATDGHCRYMPCDAAACF